VRAEEFVRGLVTNIEVVREEWRIRVVEMAATVLGEGDLEVQRVLGVLVRGKYEGEGEE